MAGKKRRFGRVRKLPSGRYQARYLGPDGIDWPAPHTFETARDADDWLAEQQTALRRGDWTDPDAGAINFEEYATRWVDERDLAATTDALYRRLLRLHILPPKDHPARRPGLASRAEQSNRRDHRRQVVPAPEGHPSDSRRR